MLRLQQTTHFYSLAGEGNVFQQLRTNDNGKKSTRSVTKLPCQTDEQSRK